MTFHHVTRLIVVGWLLSGVPSALPAFAQTSSAPSAALPSSYLLSDVEIRLEFETHGGCVGRCIRYRITIRGDGVVKYEDLGSPPAAATQSRTVAIDEVISLVNDFLRVRFFDAPDKFEQDTFVVREGNALLLRGGMSADGPTWDLTLRMGPRVKTVHLYMGYPTDFGRLRDLVDQMGGPQVWPVK